MNKIYNTRIAPSPTGMFHIGTARTAYFNYLAAKASGGKFILRIDDTDVVRNTQENVDVIFDSINWLGLQPDAVHYQSERIDLHKSLANALFVKGFAKKGADGELRLALPDTNPVPFWTDRIAGKVAISDKDYEFIKDMVICRADGSPVYNFCSVVDDIDMDINFVMRGTDHISNTGKQELIRWALGHVVDRMEDVEYAHVGLMTLGNTKISKRDPSHREIAALATYQTGGILPDAMKNFLLRMGWGPKVDDKSTAVLPVSRALELFLDGGNLKSNPAKLDLDKLAAYQRKYTHMAKEANNA